MNLFQLLIIAVLGYAATAVALVGGDLMATATFNHSPWGNGPSTPSATGWQSRPAPVVRCEIHRLDPTEPRCDGRQAEINTRAGVSLCARHMERVR